MRRGWRRGRRRRWRKFFSVLGAVLSAALVLQVVVAVLTNAHRRRNLQPLDFRLEATAPVRQAKEEQLGSEARSRNKRMEASVRSQKSHFWQKSCPQFRQWWRRSVSEKRTVQPEQLSTTSSFTQWSAAERPGCSLTDQLKTRPRPSPTRILLWSLSRGWRGQDARREKAEKRMLGCESLMASRLQDTAM